MKIYKSSKPSLYYRILFVTTVILTIALITAIVITGKIPYAGIGGYLLTLSTLFNLKKSATSYVTINNGELCIKNSKDESINPQNCFIIDNLSEVIFSKDKWYQGGSFLIGIKQKESLIVNNTEIGSLQQKDIEELISDLRALGVKVDAIYIN